MVLLQPDPFLSDLTSMFERGTELALFGLHLNDVNRNKMATAGEPIEYRCLIRATDGKNTISASVGAKDHQRIQSSYATILKALMTSLKKKERKDRKRKIQALRSPRGFESI